jgi:NAD(P)-dependent dehydrogenase (short-subunit alcohol dehydrogenase family)
MLHKSVLVTGGASGTGLAITELFLSEGANVFVLDFSGDNLEAAKIQLCKIGFNEAAFRLHQADAADEESVAKAVTECIAVFGSLDVAILNAGVGSVSVIADTSVEEYDRVMRANARSGWPDAHFT